jgi:arylsulfatase A-like enzyme
MPNRMSMLTGQHPRNHGQWTNGLLLDPLPLTLPEHLRRQGWRTASIGKIHLTPTGADDRSYESRKRWKALAADPNSGGAYAHTGPYAGFEHVELTLGHGGAAFAHHDHWFRANGGTDEMLELIRDEGIPESTGVRPMPVALHSTSFVAERSEALIERLAGDDTPFFAQVSFPDPHHPFDPPEEAAREVDPAREPAPIGGPADLADRPPHYMAVHHGQWGRQGVKDRPAHPGGISAEHTAILRARTTAMVNMIDAAVGRVMAALERTGLRDSTLVVFTSDHGEMLGDHGMWRKGPFSFRGLINTPLILSGPGVANGVSRRLISDVDLAPTLCGAVGAEPLPFANGRDLWSHVQDPAAPTRDAALVEYRTGFADYACAMHVTQQTTYVRFQDGLEELNDLAIDPGERKNHAADQPDRCDELRAALLDMLLSTQARGPEQLSHA